MKKTIFKLFMILLFGITTKTYSAERKKTESDKIIETLSTSTNPDTLLQAAKSEANLIKMETESGVMHSKHISVWDSFKHQLGNISDWVKRNRVKLEVAGAVTVGILITALVNSNSKVSYFKRERKNYLARMLLNVENGNTKINVDGKEYPVREYYKFLCQSSNLTPNQEVDKNTMEKTFLIKSIISDVQREIASEPKP